eukprot:TRINITY_DN15835_c0_g2_i4.p1 TRINITY_DN15835_c0_g2~~TRINITY_DN15835_c0_g2_i4.p1  ORF type:complete len:200 (+),score=47.64 TRINITY_DN15835_c0_g2_i4:497-1096(+)
MFLLPSPPSHRNSANSLIWPTKKVHNVAATAGDPYDLPSTQMPTSWSCCEFTTTTQQNQQQTSTDDEVGQTFGRENVAQQQSADLEFSRQNIAQQQQSGDLGFSRQNDTQTHADSKNAGKVAECHESKQPPSQPRRLHISKSAKLSTIRDEEMFDAVEGSTSTTTKVPPPTSQSMIWSLWSRTTALLLAKRDNQNQPQE